MGCGDGELLHTISSYFPEATYSGIDSSLFIIEQNKSRYPSYQFNCADIVYLTNSKQSYDVVICSEVIEHILDYKKAIVSIANYVKPGGILIITTQSGKRYYSDIKVGHTQHFTCNELNSLLQKHHFSSLKLFRTGFPFYTLQKIIYHLFPRFGESMHNDSTNTLRVIKRVLFNIIFILFKFSIKNKALGPQLFYLGKKAD